MQIVTRWYQQKTVYASLVMLVGAIGCIVAPENKVLQGLLAIGLSGMGIFGRAAVEKLKNGGALSLLLAALLCSGCVGGPQIRSPLLAPIDLDMSPEEAGRFGRTLGTVYASLNYDAQDLEEEVLEILAFLNPIDGEPAAADAQMMAIIDWGLGRADLGVDPILVAAMWNLVYRSGQGLIDPKMIELVRAVGFGFVDGILDVIETRERAMTRVMKATRSRGAAARERLRVLRE